MKIRESVGKGIDATERVKSVGAGIVSGQTGATSGPQARGPSAARGGRVSLSKEATALARSGELERFDAAKVDALRNALDRGELELDAGLVATRIVGPET
ncbi:MAG: flagellar biosynthesis anti-sigma factor FlgM [Polyangiaceae bacterium]